MIHQAQTRTGTDDRQFLTNTPHPPYGLSWRADLLRVWHWQPAS